MQREADQVGLQLDAVGILEILKPSTPLVDRVGDAKCRLQARIKPSLLSTREVER